MAIRDIDFKTLTLKDALDLATLIEEEACNRYQMLAEQLAADGAPDAIRFFRKMIDLEQEHRDELARRRHMLFGDAPARMTRAMAFDIETPDDGHAHDLVTLREALDLAMRSEMKAYNFFVQALPQVRDTTVRDLFEDLRDEEVEHRRWVQQEIDRLPREDGKEEEGDEQR